MRKYLIGLLTVVSLLLMSNFSQASHIAGGDFSYQCIGQDSFLITLNLFRDCSGATVGTSFPTTYTSPCGTQSVTLTLDTMMEVSQLCPSAINNSTCNGGSLPGMQQYIFSGIVVLQPCALGTWELGWSLCCRNGSENLNGQPNMYLDAELNNFSAPCNNSPEFNAQPIPYVCANQQVVYNFGVTEIDGDSLTFTLGVPYASSGGPAPYQGGYSSTSPFNVPVSLNSVTGELTFTPTSNGMWVIKVCANEYRNGSYIGQICRDIQFVVQSCANNQPYMINPGITNFQGTGIQVDSNSIEVCYGDSISFDIFFSDSLYTQSNPAQTYGDSVTLSSNILAQLPGAIITYTHGDTAWIHVEWVVPSSGVNSFYVFVVNAIDDACNIPGMTSNAFDITVTEWTYAGPDQSLCSGEDTAFFSAIGGSEFEWSVIPNPDGSAGDPMVTSGPNQNFSDTTGTNAQNVWAYPAFTTTYQLTSNLSGTCKNIDTVTVFVVRNFQLSTYGDTAVCPNDSLYNFQIGAVPDTSASAGTDPFNFSYQWSNGGNLNFDTVSDPLVNSTGSIIFNVTVSSDSGCVKTDEVQIDFAPDFPQNIAVNFVDTILCLGDSTLASVDFGNIISPTCGLSPTTCTGPVSVGVSGTSTTSNTTTTYPAPYGNWYWGARHQILYTAAELQAMGMTNGGRISSIGFNVVSTNSSPTLQNYTIRIGCTPANNMNTTWLTGLTTVYGPVNHTPVNGWNVHSFPTPYDWDGTSNLVVEICFNNSSFTSNASTTYSTTPFTSVRYFRQDASGVCNNSSLSGTSANRPNTQFEFCTGYDPAAFNYHWSPNTAISDTAAFDPSVYPTTNTTYYVTLTDTFGACWDTASRELEVVTSYDASFSFNNPLCLNAGVDSAVANTPGGIWTGNGIVDSVNGIFDPFSAGVGQHTVNYTVSSPAGNCATADSFTLQVIPLPDAGYSGPTTFCRSGGPYTLTPNTPGGVWSGPGITDTINGIFDPNGQQIIINQVTVYYTLNTPCHNTDTFILRLYDEVDFEFIQDPVTVCANDTLVLFNNFDISGNPAFDSLQTIHSWSGTNITNPDSGYFTPAYVGTDTAYLTVSDTNGLCAATKALEINISPVDTPNVFGDLEFCDNLSSAVINVDQGWNTSNSTWTLTPISGSGNLTINNGSFNPSVAGEGSWVLDYSYTNLNGCTGYLTDTITVYRSPVEPTLSSDTFCVGEDVIIRASGSEPDSVFWYSSSNVDPQNNIGSGNTFFWNVATEDDVDNPKTVYARAENEYCYSNVVSYVIPVTPAPDVTIRRDYVDSTGASVSSYDLAEVISGDAPFNVAFNAEGANVPPDSVYWDFWNNGSSEDGPYGWPAISSNGDAPYYPYTYEKEGTYLVMLITTNQFGCADTAYAQHEVNFEAEPPNVFTPNGDGINDEFYIPGATGLRDFSCIIYNRWGRQVYEWTDPAQGWDGEDANDGVYYYIVVGKRGDGSDYTRQGTVTLTRGK